MDVRFSRSSGSGWKDPHDWNTWDHYRTIHDRRLEEHPFIDRLRPNTLVFTEREDEGRIYLLGQIFCRKNAVLEVRKMLETRLQGHAKRVRGFSYVYVAWVQGHHPILRYHNIHERDADYHHRVFNWRTGKEVSYENLQRFQFPTLSEVLDEVERAVAAFE